MFRITTSLLACFLFTFPAAYGAFRGLRALNFNIQVTNRRGESTICAAKGKALICQDQIEAFKHDGKPYVFEKTFSGSFQYKELKYNIDITDEMGHRGKCGVALKDKVIFCSSGLSNFQYQGREWGFITRRNGFLEYIPWFRLRVRNRLGQTTLCSVELPNTLTCEDAIEPFKHDDQTYVNEGMQRGFPLYRVLNYDLTITDELGHQGQCGMVVKDELMFCQDGLSDFTYKNKEWGFKSRRNGFLEYIVWD